MTKHSIASPEGARGVDPAHSEDTRDALLNLEGPICDLASMSRILADLLDRELVDPNRSGYGNWSIELTNQQMDTLCFAWNDVANRALAVEKKFYAAAHSKAVAA